MFKKILILTLFLNLIFLGCGSNGTKSDPLDPTTSLVFGYIDMEDAPTNISWFTIKKFKPKPQIEYYCAVNDNLFWHIGLPPGSHQATVFGGQKPWPISTKYQYSFPTGRNQTAVIIEKPGVYFLGAYKYTEIETEGLFTANKLSLKKIESPTEKELLNKLLKVLNEKDKEVYKRQIQMVKQRLAEIK